MEKPKDYPDIVYKYRNWTSDTNKAVIKNNELFMTSPKDFNDPFDCRIPINYSLLNTPEKIQRFAIEFTERHKEWLINNDYNLKSEIEAIKYDYTNDMESMQAKHESILFNSQDKHYGVLSMTTDWDNILMWSHYGDFHRGYCVGFWEDQMRRSQLFGKGGPVTYDKNNNYPVIDPISNENKMVKGFKETHTKAFDWKYENEYRFYNLYFPKEAMNNDRKVIIPNEFFADITIGIMTPEDHKNEIIEIAKKNGIKVYQAKKVPFKFKITREEIK